MKTNEIKKIVKKITGFEYVAVRKGTGSHRGDILIFTSCNDKCSMLPFKEEFKKAFNVDIYSPYTVVIKA